MTVEIQEQRPTFFLQEVLLRPFAEGAERVNRAIAGIDFHDARHSEIGLLQRCWTLLVGISLMIPIVNVVIWICMKTFGNPEILSNPVSGELQPIEAADWIPAEEIDLIEEVAEPQPVRGAPLEPPRTVKYTDLYNDETINSDWTFEKFEDTHVVKRVAENNHSEAETTFDLNWNLKTFYIRLPNAKATLERRGNSLFIDGVVENNTIKKELKFPNKPYPWIQQPTTGFRPFILSRQTTLRFYGVHPTSYEICECIATKEQDQLANHGKVTKVVFHLNEGLLSLFGGTSHLGTCWFDPKNGDLLKMEYRLGVFAWGTSELVKD